MSVRLVMFKGVSVFKGVSACVSLFKGVRACVYGQWRECV